MGRNYQGKHQGYTENRYQVLAEKSRYTFTIRLETAFKAWKRSTLQFLNAQLFRGGYQGDGGGRRYNHNQHDDRDDVGGGGGRGAGNRVWTRGGTVHNRLGPRTV